MRLIAASAFTVVLLCGGLVSAQQAPAPKTAPESSRKPAAESSSRSAADRDAFSFLRYTLEVRIDPPSHGFNARGTILVRNDSSQPQKLLTLQVSSLLKWAAVTFDSKPLSFESKTVSSDVDHTGAVNEATVSLPQEIAPGATVVVGVGYQGAISQSSARLQKLGMPSSLGARSDWDRISDSFTGIRGVGYVIWYPVSIQPTELGEGNRAFDLLGKWKARHALSSMQLDVSAVCDPGDILLSSGEVSSGTNPCHRSISFEPFGMDVPVLVVGQFKLSSNQAGSVYSSAQQQEGGQFFAQRLSVLEPFAESLFGPQLRKVQVVGLPEPGAAPFESGALLLTTLDTENEWNTDMQAVNLLTHGCVESDRAWISTGLGHYAQARLLAERSSRQAALDFLEQRRPALALAEPENPDPTRNTLIKAGDEVFYRTKAMFVWWMLHDIIGDSAMEKALAAYDPKSDRDPAYIEHLLENASKQNLSWFFDDWVYRDRGLPDFRITAVYPRQNLRGGYIVSVTVENTGSAGAEVPIRLHSPETDIPTRLQVMGNESVTMRVETPTRPTEAIVNDGSVPESDPGNNSFDVPAPKQ